MTDQLKMLDQTTCEDSTSVISSLASADGLVPCDSPDGLMIEPSGQEVVRASRSRSQASKKVSTIQDTYGLSGSVLSPSENLQYVLANKLRELLTGSTSCEVIWKKWVTPWGQCLSKPRARTRIISEIDFGLWPTMTSNAPAKGYNEAGNSAGQVAIRKIMLGLWPTATTPSGGQTVPEGTSISGKTKDGRKLQVTLQNVVIALWSTLRASDGAKGGPNMSFGAGGSPLPSQVSKEASMSNAPMENGGGSLHPEFAGWEMGYPPEWLNCAPLVTRSIRGAQRNSSKRMSKQPDTDRGEQ